LPGLFRTKSIDALIEESEQKGRSLQKTLGPWSLTALGIGAVIGSGIFTLTGTAAAGQTLEVHSILHAPILDLLWNGANAVSTIGRPGAGPGVALSFILVAIACSFAALCYAELASMIPVAGSAYTYAYATLGEIVAWIIGWDLILEYAVSNMAVAVGFSAYFNAILEALFNVHLPRELSEPMIVNGQMSGAWFNVPALLIILLLTWILVRGAKESAGANGVMVIIKLAAILLFVFGAARAVNTANWHPFMPNGFTGVLSGAAIVFFTYIGFDSVSTAAEECKNPKRDMPLGIFMTLAICAVLYSSVALVLTGIADWRTLGNAAPVANALKAIGFDSGQRGRRGGYDQFADGFPIRPGAHLVCDVARQTAARHVLEGAPEVPHAPYFNVGGRLLRGHSGGDSRHRHAGRSRQYWNAFRLRAGVGRRDCPAPYAAGAGARLSRSVGAVSANPEYRDVRDPDVGFAAGNVDPLLRVAHYGLGGVLPVQP